MIGKFEIAQPYDIGIGNDNKDCVIGPGTGFGYYAGSMFPHLRCDSQVEAQRAASMCNLAFRQGYEQAQRDLRAVLGIAGR